MDRAETIKQWRYWVETKIGGPEDRIAAVLQSVITTIEQGKSTEEAVATAHRTAALWDRESAVGSPHPDGGKVSIAQAPTPTQTGEFAGILDIVSADKSELGRATLVALKALDFHTTMREKAFLATPGFRGRYGFHGGRSRFGRLLAILVAVSLIEQVFVVPLPLYKQNIAFLSINTFLNEVILVIFGIALLWVIWILIGTALLAHRAKVECSVGRLTITYGLFSTTQNVIEIHWIREVGWSQTFVQKLLGEASLWISLDTPSRGIATQVIPGLVPVSEMQLLANKIRNAAQKLRQGNYYARSFIG